MVLLAVVFLADVSFWVRCVRSFNCQWVGELVTRPIKTYYSYPGILCSLRSSRMDPSINVVHHGHQLMRCDKLSNESLPTTVINTSISNLRTMTWHLEADLCYFLVALRTLVSVLTRMRK